MRLFYRLKAFVKKESPYENEADSLLLLLRTVLLVCTPFYLCMLVYSLIKPLGIRISVTFIVGIIGYLSIFIMTYKCRSRICMLSMIIFSILIAASLTITFGWRASFQNFLYMVLLIMWYDPTSSQIKKAGWSVVICAAICYISRMTPFGASLITPGTTPYLIIQYSNIIIFSLCISIVAYYFCNQHIEAEHKLREYNTRLKMLSETDPLTRLMNRRCAEGELQNMVKESKSQKYLFCIAIADIDHFKNVNDTYGHDAGDFILTSLADDFNNYMKDKGFVSRWGGEEFLFAMPHTNGDQALMLFDDLRLKIHDRKYVYKDTEIPITITVGIEEYSNKDGIKKAIENADKKLYMGKESGRDTVIF